MRRILMTMVVVVGAFSMTAVSFAASFTFNGNWRAGYRFFDGLDLDQNNNYFDADGNNITDSDDRTFVLHRLRLNPMIHVTDDLSVYVQSDIFTTRIGLGSTTGTYWGRPAVAQGGGIDYGIPSDAERRDYFAGDYSHQSSENAALEHIQFRRAWAEWNTEYGVLRAGRMPRHFGLGMWWNDGNGVWDYWQDTIDSLNFEITTGNLTFVPFYDIVNEGSAPDPSFKTTHSGGWLIYDWLDQDLEAGFMYGYRHKADSDIRLHTFDSYIEKEFPNIGFLYDGNIRLAGEGVFIFGRHGWARVPRAGSDINATKLGIATEMDYTRGGFTFWTRFGFASGQELERPSDDQIFVFDRNYNIALILFRMGVGRLPQTGVAPLGAGPATTIQGYGELNAGNVEYANTIHNTWYVSGGAGHDFAWATDWFGSWAKDFRGSLWVTWARAHQEAVVNQYNNRGVEADTSFAYRWNKNLYSNLDFGVLFPGEFYKGTVGDNANNFQRHAAYAFAFSTALTF